MFEIGQVFKKNGNEYTVLDIIDYSDNKYVLFAVEKEKIDYVFFKIYNKNEQGVDLKEVKDIKLKKQLYDICFKKINRSDRK